MRALLLALCALILAQPASAERFSLDYDASAIGILPLGEATIDFDISADTYAVDATLRSRGLLALFEPTDLTARARGRIVDGQVRWERYDLDHHYSRKHRVIAMHPTETSVAATIEPNFRLWGDPPTSDEQKRTSRDPLSTLIAMAIDVQRTRRCNADYPTFDGRFHYRLELRGGRADHVEAGGYDGPTLHCRMRYVAVAGFERGDGGRRRTPEGDIWFALVDDAIMAPPVRIRLPMGIARAHIALSQWRRPEVEIDTAAAPSAAPATP